MTDARRVYDAWHRALEVEQPDDALSPWHEAAIPYVGDLTGSVVLEIACGRGAFARWLAGRGARCIAFADYSTAAVAIAKRDVAPLAPEGGFLAGNIERLPFADATFDLICSFETLEHVPSPSAGLAELVRVTKPGGRLIITTPNYIGLLGLYRAFRNLTGRPYAETGQPINQPVTLIGRVRALRALGCQVDVIDGFGHYLYLPGRRPRRMFAFDRVRAITRWFGAHSLTVATRGARGAGGAHRP